MAKKKKIKYDSNNFRKHSDKNKRMIRKSLEELGAGRSVVIDADDELIAGNGVYEQAEALGLGIKVVETDGSELVVVKRTDLHSDDERRKRLAFADNATSDHVEWDFGALEMNIDAETLKAFNVVIPDISLDTDEGNAEYEEIERKKSEFEEKMSTGEFDEDDQEYQEFIEKFKLKRTSDDCYTPEEVYDSVADWVANEYSLSRANFVRPFYPGGDYQKEQYKESDIVVDNPPFSIMTKILDYYNNNGIRYFLFAPHLTIFNASSLRCTALPVGVSITYANGAVVNTSFLTNLEPKDIRFRSEPRLYAAVQEANKKFLKSIKKQLPKYVYPKQVITAYVIKIFSSCGIDFVAHANETEPIDGLDSQKFEKRGIYGKGFLISERLAAEREKAERLAAERAERERAEREKAEREKAVTWELSEREYAIISKLSSNQHTN